MVNKIFAIIFYKILQKETNYVNIIDNIIYKRGII